MVTFILQLSSSQTGRSSPETCTLVFLFLPLLHNFHSQFPILVSLVCDKFPSSKELHLPHRGKSNILQISQLNILKIRACNSPSLCQSTQGSSQYALFIGFTHFFQWALRIVNDTHPHTIFFKAYLNKAKGTQTQNSNSFISVSANKAKALPPNTIGNKPEKNIAQVTHFGNTSIRHSPFLFSSFAFYQLL